MHICVSEVIYGRIIFMTEMKLDTLFDILDDENKKAEALTHAPLARRMRAQTIDDFIGQKEVLGDRGWLRRAIEADAMPSIILYGPAGCGKTSLANIIASTTHYNFEEVSAISGGVADLKRVIGQAKDALYNSAAKTILFVDEIHRFSRSQQDYLLHAVEDRIVILIGATTENPYFEINSALLSRTRIVLMKALCESDISTLLDRSLTSSLGLDNKFSLDDDAREEILSLCGCDARFALNCIELASQMCASDDRDAITLQDVRAISPERRIFYDKNKDEHYDTISAFIKSMRGSDPDAALYWMAKMLVGGEDPKFIARRIMISASEDVGNADPNAILIAHAAFKACETIGMPECAINLAQAAVYNALAPKSNAACAGIFKAMDLVRQTSEKPVPDYLRDRHRPGAESYGEYKYPHDFEDAWVPQQYLPDGVKSGDIFKPSSRGWEASRAKAIDEIKKSR